MSTLSTAAAEKLADHLERKARPMAEPQASLSLGRVDVSGRPGERLGPVTIRTDAPSVAIMTPSGAADAGGPRRGRATAGR